MHGSGFGHHFHISSWGESHGKAVGVVIDGCPAGLTLTEPLIQAFLDRRKPGQSEFTTARKESDSVEILSGVFEDTTTGTPISLMVRNQDQRSGDYTTIKDAYRPGHADYTYDMKYGIRDYRGGGRASARETIARVCGGAVASLILQEMGISFVTYVKSIGNVEIQSVDASQIYKNPLYMPDEAAFKKAEMLLKDCMHNKDSVGSVVECIIKNVPAGLGEPVFEKLDGVLSGAVMSINAVKAVEIGSGCEAGTANASYLNDSFFKEGERITKKTNHAGGILGGISDGSDIILRATFKPTPSIAASQETVKGGENAIIEIKGRHDPVIGPRGVVVVESMCAMVILDMLMANMSARLSGIKAFYKDLLS